MNYDPEPKGKTAAIRIKAIKWASKGMNLAGWQVNIEYWALNSTSPLCPTWICWVVSVRLDVSPESKGGTGGTRQSGCGLCVQRKNTQIFGFVLSYKPEDSHLLVRASG